jgi:hypothetical protein
VPGAAEEPNRLSKKPGEDAAGAAPAVAAGADEEPNKLSKKPGEDGGAAAGEL